MFWKPGDVFEIMCPKCGYQVEFFKFDVKRKCRCGHEMINPRINFGCAEWCPYGDNCIQGLPEEMQKRTKEEKNNRLRERIYSEMKRYFGSDMKRVNHALKVAEYARDILGKLNVQRGIVEEICDMIGHHHHPREKETLHFQILFEADWLSNMEEDGFSKDPKKLEEIIEKNFKTMTGKKLASEFLERVTHY